MPRLILFLAILAVFPQHSAWSSSRNGHLTEITVSSDQTKEHIQLLFQNDFNEIPSIDFEKGLVRITLPNTGYNPGIGYKKVNDRFLQTIRLEKEGKNTILEIQFADPDLFAVDMITHRTDNTELHIYIDKKKKSGDNNLKNDSLPLFDKEETSQKASFAGRSEFYRDNITTNIIKMLLALAALLLFLYLLLWLYNRFFVSKFNFNKGKYSIKVTSSYHISPKQKIVMLEVNDIAFACGVTPNNINVIAKISDDSFVNYLTNLDLSHDKEIDFSELRTQYIESRKPKDLVDNNKPPRKTSFSSELISRIKKLHPID